MGMNNIKLIFVVGFPRSGTTLLQTILMGSPKVHSIPETHIFTKGMRLSFLPAPLANIWTSLYCFLWIKRNYSEAWVYYSFSTENLVKKFFIYLQKKAELEGKTILVEKTPAHLSKIEYISTIFPEAKYIHVCRNYKEAIPSYIKAAKEWGINHTECDAMVRWMADMISTYEYSKTDGHVIVTYETMVRNRNLVIEFLNKKYGLLICNLNDEQLVSNAQKIVEKSEQWKTTNITGIRVAEPRRLDIAESIELLIAYMSRD
jgi:hypothetical protein